MHSSCSLCPLGSWWVRSVADSRWNGSGRERVEGSALLQKVQEHIKSCEKKYGKSVPFEWSYATAHCGASS